MPCPADKRCPDKKTANVAQTNLAGTFRGGLSGRHVPTGRPGAQCPREKTHLRCYRTNILWVLFRPTTKPCANAAKPTTHPKISGKMRTTSAQRRKAIKKGSWLLGLLAFLWGISCSLPVGACCGADFGTEMREPLPVSVCWRGGLLDYRLVFIHNQFVVIYKASPLLFLRVCHVFPRQ